MSQVILFDLDGTLTESGEGIINCVQYALEKIGKPEEEIEKLKVFVGPPLLEQFMKYAGIEEETAHQAVAYYRERYAATGIFENCLYEGYGPSGIAVIVECLTDNRNRTAGEMRHYFDKCGGNLGTPGSVTFMFTRRGLIAIDAEGLSEDEVMEAALEAGADDFNAEDGVFEVITDANSVSEISTALSEKGYKIMSAEPEYYPATFSSITDDEAMTKMQKLLDMLDDNDDVQNVWHNLDNLPEEE